MKKTRSIASIILRVVLVCTMTFAFIKEPVLADVYYETYGDFEYIVLDDGTIRIVGYIGDSDTVIIPRTIDGKDVTSIGLHNDRFGLDITLPETVTRIEDWAFYGYGNLEITIFGLETDFGDYCFDRDVVIWCYEGSSAEEYAINNNLTCNYLTPIENLESDSKSKTSLSIPSSSLVAIGIIIICITCVIFGFKIIFGKKREV